MANALSPRFRRPARKAAPPLPPGTVVLTLDGALPVEFLAPGDRVVTRAGARTLRHVRPEGTPANGFRLGFDAPEVIYADGREIGTQPLT